MMKNKLILGISTAVMLSSVPLMAGEANFVDFGNIQNAKTHDKAGAEYLKNLPKWSKNKMSIQTGMITLYDLLNKVIPSTIDLRVDNQIMLNYKKMVIPSLNIIDKPLYEVIERIKDSYNVFIDIDERSCNVKLTKNLIVQLPLNNTIENETKVQIGADSSDSGANSNISSNSTITSAEFDKILDDINDLLNSYTEGSPYGDSVTHYIFGNKDTGIITISGTRQISSEIKNYVDSIINENRKSILVEAKIIKFANSDTTALGISWNQVFETLNLSNLGSMRLTIGKPAIGDTSNSIVMSDPFAAGQQTGIINFGTSATPDAVVKALDSQGLIENVSEPKLKISNNQPTTIFSGTVKTYVSEITVEQTERGSSTSYDTDVIQEGFNMTLKPRILPNGEEIELFIVPVLNNVLAMNEAGDGETRLKLPIIDSRSLNLITKIKNGETIVLAGLKEKSKNSTGSGLPVLSKLPFVKNLFGYKENIQSENELIIILKAKILD